MRKAEDYCKRAPRSPANDPRWGRLHNRHRWQQREARKPDVRPNTPYDWTPHTRDTL